MSTKIQQEKIQLYSWSKNDISLRDSIAFCQSHWRLELPWVLLYMPKHCLLSRLNSGGEILDYLGQSIDLTAAYEARIFSPIGELRWQRVGVLGQAAFLSEKNNLAPNNWQACADIDDFADIYRVQDGHFLLWGEYFAEAQNTESNWSRLIDARVGDYYVPLSNLTEKTRAVLCFREYAGLVTGMVGEVHGNMQVCEQRLLQIEVIDKSKLGKINA